ncbi:hypothetical protein HHL22_08900 [Hymenobacter sp. RP-2-7]|uniref:Uncharacterized protein n=1 Tax=Hymenobacter polaris TaxID=2682546 RepID=A0A7Y0ADH1_9BACT|nr:hypothetical protein [Hymenobacter polaris]NML65320.1 hypothetical protein [Hymenobacter polaris]
MKIIRYSIVLVGLLSMVCGAARRAAAQVVPARPPAKPVPRATAAPKPAPRATATPRPAGTRPAGTRAPLAPKAPPAPIEAAQRVEPEEVKPPVVIRKVKLQDPVLVFYQQGAPTNAVQQLLMEEKNLPLLKTESLEKLVERREVFIDGLGNYPPPASDAEKFRLTGVSLLASSEKRKAAPDGRSTYARLKVPSPGDLYVVRESAEDYRHFVSGPQKQGARIDFSVNGLPGVDSVRAAYTLRKIDLSERGAGSGDIIR